MLGHALRTNKVERPPGFDERRWGKLHNATTDEVLPDEVIPLFDLLSIKYAIRIFFGVSMLQTDSEMEGLTKESVAEDIKGIKMRLLKADYLYGARIIYDCLRNIEWRAMEAAIPNAMKASSKEEAARMILGVAKDPLTVQIMDEAVEKASIAVWKELTSR